MCICAYHMKEKRVVLIHPIQCVLQSSDQMFSDIRQILMKLLARHSVNEGCMHIGRDEESLCCASCWAVCDCISVRECVGELHGSSQC